MQIAVVSQIQPDVCNESSTTERQAKTIRHALLADNTPDGLNRTLKPTQWRSGDSETLALRRHHGFRQIRRSGPACVNCAPEQYPDAGDPGYFPSARPDVS
jgi:hypothetical protein